METGIETWETPSWHPLKGMVSVVPAISVTGSQVIGKRKHGKRASQQRSSQHFVHSLSLACVQTPPLLREGGRLYTGYLSLDCFGYQLASQMLPIEILCTNKLNGGLTFIVLCPVK